MLGTAGFILGIVVLDSNYPEIFTNIPVVHTISGNILDAFDIIYRLVHDRLFPTPETPVVLPSGQGAIITGNLNIPNLHIDNQGSVATINILPEMVTGGHLIQPPFIDVQEMWNRYLNSFSHLPIPSSALNASAEAEERV